MKIKDNVQGIKLWTAEFSVLCVLFSGLPLVDN